jgi:hypothetical protein
MACPISLFLGNSQGLILQPKISRPCSAYKHIILGAPQQLSGLPLRHVAAVKLLGIDEVYTIRLIYLNEDKILANPGIGRCHVGYSETILVQPKGRPVLGARRARSAGGVWLRGVLAGIFEAVIRIGRFRRIEL